MTFFWTTRLVKFEKPDSEFLKAVTLPSFLHAFGHCLTNVSFAAVAVSFTHTIKMLEPVFSAIGSYLVTGTVYAWPVYMALVPIMGGVALASATELSFTWLGFSTAMASNVAFSARAIFSKKLMAKMSPLNLYNFVTIVSLLFCIPFVIAFEGSTLAAGIAKAVELKGQKEFVLGAAQGWRVLSPLQPGGVPGSRQGGARDTRWATSVSASSSSGSPSSRSATRSRPRPRSALPSRWSARVSTVGSSAKYAADTKTVKKA